MMDKAAFERSLEAPLAFWDTKTAREVEELVGAPAAAMVGFEQHNPHHCYPLFQHVLHTVAGLPRDAPPELRAAAFFHDVGKPRCAMWKQGRLVFYGHAAKSVDLARPALAALGYSEGEQALICFYIRHHDDFIPYVLPSEAVGKKNPYLRPITEETVRAYLAGMAGSADLFSGHCLRDGVLRLLDLCCADVSAQSELVYQGGKRIDSREHKLEKLRLIRSLLLQMAD